MEFKKQKVAIVGGGPAGCMCAYYAQDRNEVTVFEYSKPLGTLLYTGGGRCNLAYAEYDFKELAKFYPRGERFLYSVFSRFSTTDTVDFFNTIGVKTYTQDDMRIFPTSNSAVEVREKFLKALNKCTIKKVRAQSIEKLDSEFSVVANNEEYFFNKVIFAVGGHAGFSLAQSLGHKIIEPKPALAGLISKQNFKQLQGVSLKNIKAEVSYQGKKLPPVQDDFIFTHEGISGPLAYKISSICARENYSKESPLIISLDLISKEIDLQNMLNFNPKKDIKNLVSELVPKSLAEYILKSLDIEPDLKCCNVNGKTRDLILDMLYNLRVDAILPAKDGEVVTSGGVSLDEINPKTMQSKLVEGLYFCGEVIDVDGFCGGFNLQNCWSTGFVAGSNI